MNSLTLLLVLLSTGLLSPVLPLTIGEDRVADRHFSRWTHSGGLGCENSTTVLEWFPNQPPNRTVRAPYLDRLTFNSTLNTVDLKDDSGNEGCWETVSSGVNLSSTTHRFEVRNLGRGGQPTVRKTVTVRLSANEGDDVTFRAVPNPQAGMLEWEVDTAFNGGWKVILQYYKGQQKPIVYKAFQGRVSIDLQNNTLILKSVKVQDSGMYKSEYDLDQRNSYRFILKVSSSCQPDPKQNPQPTLPRPAPSTLDPANVALWVSLALATVALFLGITLWYFRETLFPKKREIELVRACPDPVIVHILQGSDSDLGQ